MAKTKSGQVIKGYVTKVEHGSFGTFYLLVKVSIPADIAKESEEEVVKAISNLHLGDVELTYKS